MMKLSVEAIRVYLSDWEDTLDPLLKRNLCEAKMDWVEHYRSPCGRFSLMTTTTTNMLDPKTGIGWNLHIDNSSMCTIGSLSVEFIEQVKQIMEIYKDY